jgi:hypothetical protein
MSLNFEFGDGVPSKIRELRVLKKTGGKYKRVGPLEGSLPEGLSRARPILFLSEQGPEILVILLLSFEIIF